MGGGLASIDISGAAIPGLKYYWFFFLSFVETENG
jgi:hypothetical protein